MDKRTYRSLAESEEAAALVRAEHERIWDSDIDIMYGYKCKFGNHFHYGHNRGRGTLRKEEEEQFNDRQKHRRTRNIKNVWGDRHAP